MAITVVNRAEFTSTSGTYALQSASGNNRMLIIMAGCCKFFTATSVTSATLNSVNATSLLNYAFRDSQAYDTSARLFVLTDADLPASTGNYSFSFACTSGATDTHAVIYELTGVNQTIIDYKGASAGSGDATITTLATGSGGSASRFLVISSYCRTTNTLKCDSTTITPNANCETTRMKMADTTTTATSPTILSDVTTTMLANIVTCIVLQDAPTNVTLELEAVSVSADVSDVNIESGTVLEIDNITASANVSDVDVISGTVLEVDYIPVTAIVNDITIEAVVPTILDIDAITVSTDVSDVNVVAGTVLELGNISVSASINDVDVISGTVLELGNISVSTDVSDVNVVAGTVLEAGNITASTNVGDVNIESGTVLELGNISVSTDVSDANIEISTTLELDAISVSTSINDIGLTSGTVLEIDAISISVDATDVNVISGTVLNLDAVEVTTAINDVNIASGTALEIDTITVSANINDVNVVAGTVLEADTVNVNVIANDVNLDSTISLEIDAVEVTTSINDVNIISGTTLELDAVIVSANVSDVNVVSGTVLEIENISVSADINDVNIASSTTLNLDAVIVSANVSDVNVVSGTVLEADVINVSANINDINLTSGTVLEGEPVTVVADTPDTSITSGTVLQLDNLVASTIVNDIGLTSGTVLEIDAISISVDANDVDIDDTSVVLEIDAISVSVDASDVISLTSGTVLEIPIADTNVYVAPVVMDVFSPTMTRSFYVDSEEVIVAPNWSISDKINARSTMQVTVIDKQNATIVEGAEFTALNGTTTIFAGIILRIRKVEDMPYWITYNLDIVDNSAIADRRVIAKTYENYMAGDIVRDIIIEILAVEGVTAGTIVDGVLVRKAVFNYVTIATALDYIKDVTGLNWNIDINKQLQFFDRADNIAPFELTPSVVHAGFRQESNLDTYRNTQYVRGGQGRTAVQENEVVTPAADGKSRSFVVRFPLAIAPIIEVNLNSAGWTTIPSADIGVNGLDEAKKWYWSYGSQIITQDKTEVVLGTVDAVRLTYTGLRNLFVKIEKPTEITNMGIFEALATEKSINISEQAIEYANGLLDTYADIKDTISFTTEETGLQAGQLLTVNKPLYGIDDTFLIESVNIRPADSTSIQYTINALDGASVGGWEKFFANILKGNRDYAIAENEVLILLNTQQENDGYQGLLNAYVTTRIPHIPLLPSTTLHPGASVYPSPSSIMVFDDNVDLLD